MSLSVDDSALLDRLERKSQGLAMAFCAISLGYAIIQLNKPSTLSRVLGVFSLVVLALTLSGLFLLRRKGASPLLTHLQGGNIRAVSVEKLSMTSSSNLFITLTDGGVLKYYTPTTEETNALLALLRRHAPAASFPTNS